MFVRSSISRVDSVRPCEVRLTFNLRCTVATEQITDDELLALRVLANARGGVKLGSSVLLRLLNTVAALRAQLAERCVVVGPDEVVVGREEWAALGQIVTLVNKHINDPCYLRNQLVPIVDRVSALRSGEAGKGAG